MGGAFLRMGGYSRGGLVALGSTLQGWSSAVVWGRPAHTSCSSNPLAAAAEEWWQRCRGTKGESTAELHGVMRGHGTNGSGGGSQRSSDRGDGLSGASSHQQGSILDPYFNHLITAYNRRGAVGSSGGLWSMAMSGTAKGDSEQQRPPPIDGMNSKISAF